MNEPTSHTPAAETRRDFLKTSAAVAGALSLAAVPFVHADGDETLKVGLIGCGGRGTGAASQALSTRGNVKLVAMGDAFQWQLDNSYNGLKQALADKPDRLAVPEENKFVGLDAYQKVINSATSSQPSAGPSVSSPTPEPRPQPR